MAVIFHPHALLRMEERGATADEVIETIEEGRVSHARSGRLKYTMEYAFRGYRGAYCYSKKKVDVYAFPEEEDIIVFTVVVKYF